MSYSLEHADIWIDLAEQTLSLPKLEKNMSFLRVKME